MTVEELQIIISMKTEQVHAKIDKLKEKIAGIQPKKSPDINITTTKAQGNLKKLQAELSRTQAKIDKLNQKMAGIYEKQDTIVNKYTGLPSFTGMTKDQSFDFMVGNDPQMKNLNAQLDQLDAQTAPLKTHLAETKTQIAELGNTAESAAAETRQLSGGIGTAGSAAAPAAAKTRTLRERLQALGNGFRQSGSHANTFNRRLNMMFARMMLFRGVSMIFRSIGEGFQNIAQGSSSANNTLSQLSASALYLKNSIAASLMPALQAITPVINRVADAVANVFNNIGMLTARIFNHASTVTIAKRAAVNYAQSLSGVSKSAEKAKGSLASFDQINTLSKNQSAGSSAAAAGMPSASQMFEQVKIPQWVNNIGVVTDQVGKVIGTWWNGLTDSQKWGAGIGGTAGYIIGGIIGRLIGGPVGRVVGHVLGGAAGVAIGVWWTGLTTPEKWGAGIGAGAGTTVGGIIGGILTGGNPIGIVVGALLLGTAGAIIGKWWADLTTPEKWGVGIGAGSGAVIGGIIGGILFGPLGAVLGVGIGGVAGGMIGKWWSSLTSEQKWDVGNAAGTIAGGIIGYIFLGPLGSILGAGIGALVTNLIRKFWDNLTNAQKWRVGSTGVGVIVGGIIGTIIGGPLGTVIGSALGGAAGYGIGRLVGHASGTDYHPGGPALVNDASGSPYRELVRLPDGRAFIPHGRNVLFPDLPEGSRVLPARETKELFPNYASGIGDLSYAGIDGNAGNADASPNIQRQSASQREKDINITVESPIYLDRSGDLLEKIVRKYSRLVRLDG